MAIKLPDAKVPASAVSPRVTILYGKPKTGKTTKAAELPNNLILDLEKGSDFIDAMKISVENIYELDDVLKQLLEYKKANGGKNKYQYITIDTVGKLEEWVEIQAAIDFKKTVMGKNFVGVRITELPQGAGYGQLREYVKRYINRIAEVCDRVIIISHLKDKLISEKGGIEVTAKDIDLMGKLSTIVSAAADAIGYVYFIKDKQMISFKSGNDLNAGARAPHLKGKEMEFKWEDIFID